MELCDWVVVVDQFNQAETIKIDSIQFNGIRQDLFGEAALHPDQEVKTLRLLEYHHLRLVYDTVSKKFYDTSYWMDQQWKNSHTLFAGISSDATVEKRQILLEKNQLNIETKSIFQLLISEAVHPFYIFQLLSVTLWMVDTYYYYATAVLVLSVTSVAVNLIETYRNTKRMSKMAKFLCQVDVYRNQKCILSD